MSWFYAFKRVHTHLNLDILSCNTVILYKYALSIFNFPQKMVIHNHELNSNMI